MRAQKIRLAQAPPQPSPLAAAQGGSRGGVGPDSAGVRYETPQVAARITKAQAIQAAKDWLGPQLVSQATQIQAQHVQFSDDQYYREDTAGQKQYHFQKVSAWVVTFAGVSLPSHGKRGSTVLPNHEVNVVINADSGEYMEMYSYQ